MPDKHGRLTEADSDLIQRWWGQHSNDQVICPVCKTTSWKTAAHLVNIPRHAPDANASNTPTYPHVIVTCKLCAHSMFFNAVEIGIAPQSTAGEAGSDLQGQGILGLSRSLANLINKQD